jgi:molybdopterin-guanine dinucleotide biosynthesis protein A
MRIAAAIIAGGKATRMDGVAKGLLRDAAGNTVVQRLLNQIDAAGIADVVISANEPHSYAELNLPIIADRHADIGPLGGIEAVLSNLSARCDCVLLFPCDLPNVTTNEILILLRSHKESAGRVIFAVTAEGDHPLCAVVPVTVLDNVKAAIAAGEYSVKRLWRSLGALPVEFDDSSRMMNLNTPDDVRRWQRISTPPK